MRSAVCAFVLCLVTAGVASAQQEHSSWGVAGSVVPTWKVPRENTLSKAMFDADQVNISGSEFRIGFVRGRMLGGDWGVSFVRRRIEDGSTLVRDMDDSAGFTTGDFVTTRNVVINGIEVSKFTPFATIAKRVQIGLNYGGGIGSASGTLDTRTIDANFAIVGNRTVISPIETRESTDAKELIFPGNGLVPLGRVEVAAAVLVAPGFKVRASGGLAFPGTQRFSITGVYLIGAK